MLHLSGRLGATSRDLARLLAVLILLNLPFWILASQVFLPRALFSVDSLFAVLLLGVAPLWGAFAIAASWACDLAIASALIYHFASPLEFIQSAAFAGHLDWTQFIDLKKISLAASFVVATAGLILARPQRLRWPVVLVALLLLLLLDALNGSSLLSKRDVRVVGANLAGSSFLGLAKEALEREQDAEALVTTGASGGVAEFEALLPGVLAGSDSVLYVLVESWGIHKDPGIQEWLVRQAYPPALHASYTVKQDRLISNGSTTAGELRRLCGLQGSYRNLRSAPDTPCLPKRMADSGRNTLGLHGFSQSMFDRARWWPLLGLQRIEFAEQLAQRGYPLCGGAFHGICDEVLIAESIAATLRPRSFVYALTLNTHLPIAPISIPDELIGLCEAAKTGADVCSLHAQLGIVLRSIPRELTAQGAKPYVVIAGDHPPPFAELRARTQFAKGQVPLLVLMPRGREM